MESKTQVMKYRIFIFLLIIFKCQFSFGQTDYLYNQYSSLNFLLNPAKIANDKNGVYVFWRNQWLGFKNNPNFYSASGNIAINKSIYVGAIISRNDYGGAFSNNSFQLNGAWKGKIQNEGHFFSLGGGFRGGQFNSDFSDVVLLDQNDIEFPQLLIKKNYVDFCGGFYYRFKFLKAGFSSNSLMGLLGEKRELPYSKSVNAELGFLLNKSKIKESESEGITQLNFRGRFSDLNILQLETIFDYYPSSNYAIGCGLRLDFKEQMGNSLLFHLLIKFSKDNWNGGKALLGFGPEFTVFDNNLDRNNKGSYEGFLGYEKPVKTTSK